MTTEDLPAYFMTWSEELISRSNRVRHLIGDRHWLSDGSYKELLVKEFLLRHVPRSLDISRGFVRKLNSEDVSPEVDILISDPQLHVPLFNEGGLQIVTSSSVIATFEVKSTYSKDVLSKALENVANVRKVVLSATDSSKPWSAIFVFTATDTFSIELFARNIESILGDNAFWSGQDQPNPIPLRIDHLPSIICVADHSVAFICAGDAANQAEIRVFEAGKLSTALAFSQLFLHLREVQTGIVHPGELDTLLMRLDQLKTKRFNLSLPTP